LHKRCYLPHGLANNTFTVDRKYRVPLDQLPSRLPIRYHGFDGEWHVRTGWVAEADADRLSIAPIQNDRSRWLACSTASQSPSEPGTQPTEQHKNVKFVGARPRKVFVNKVLANTIQRQKQTQTQIQAQIETHRYRNGT
jgi:hypothetical protein